MHSTTLAMGPSFLDPKHLISTFGLIGILVMVFAESGLFFGFFLPGDSLLFTAGLLVASSHYLKTPLWLLCLLVGIAAVAGDQVGYAFGHRLGPRLFQRENSKLFRRDFLTRSEAFFDKYGARSVLLARFVPIVRTFTPIVAGASKMRYRRFLVYNLAGGVLWGAGVTVLGYYLGRISFVRSNIELILIGIVVLSVIPIAIELIRARRRRASSGGGSGSGDEADDDSDSAEAEHTDSGSGGKSDTAGSPVSASRPIRR